MEEVALAMLLDSDTEPGDSDYNDLLSTLAQYRNRGTRGSAGRLPIGEAIVRYLKYPGRSFWLIPAPRELLVSRKFAHCRKKRPPLFC